MVKIWVFAGGGEAEARGLLPFLERLFEDCEFQRRFPTGLKRNPKKPRTFPTDQDYREKQKASARGATGNSLLKQIQARLVDGIKYDPQPDLILVFDDLDCHNLTHKKRILQEAIENYLTSLGTIAIPVVVGFAAPELEAWIIADWDKSVQNNIELKRYSFEIKSCLKTYEVNFDFPENFSIYFEHDNPQEDYTLPSNTLQKGSCREKLSKILQDCVTKHTSMHYSKDTHTSDLVKKLDHIKLMDKCPIFKELYLDLKQHIESIQK